MYQIPESQEHELIKLLFENVKFSETKKEFEFQEENLEKCIKDVIEWLRDGSPKKNLNNSDSVQSNLSDKDFLSSKC